MDSGVGSSLRTPRSARRVRRYTASLVASEAAMISALQDDNATLGCFFDAQKTAAWLYTKTYPDVECRVAQFESENP
eukprot:189655-Pleurochrysis_carterae.AAC.1